MNSKKFVYWQDGFMWLGYLSEFPDYMTQADSFDELKENLTDIFLELNSGKIPCVRRVDELEIA